MTRGKVYFVTGLSLRSGRTDTFACGTQQYFVRRVKSVFKKFTNGCVRVVNRWLPDPFLFAVILSIIVCTSLP